MEQKLNQLKYDQVRLEILDYIVRHGLQVGDRLPPERSFSRSLACSGGTIRIALKALVDNGLIEKRHGMGSYLKRKVSDIAPVGKVLFVSILLKRGEIFYAPSEVCHFFAEYGIKLECRTIVDFSDLSLENLEGCLGILLTGWVTDELVSNFLALKIPVIVAGNRRLSVSVPVVRHDICEAAYRLTRHFIEKGKTRIGFWAGDDTYITLQEAQEGYVKAMEERGLPWGGLVMQWDGRPPCQRVESFVRLHDDLEVFICEMLAFTEYGQVYWSDRRLPAPDFGILPLLPQGCFKPSEHLVFADYQEHYMLVAAEQLYQAATQHVPMKTVVIRPYLRDVVE